MGHVRISPKTLVASPVAPRSVYSINTAPTISGVDVDVDAVGDVENDVVARFDDRGGPPAAPRGRHENTGSPSRLKEPREHVPTASIRSSEVVTLTNFGASERNSGGARTPASTQRACCHSRSTVWIAGSVCSVWNNLAPGSPPGQLRQLEPSNLIDSAPDDTSITSPTSRPTASSARPTAPARRCPSGCAGQRPPRRPPLL